MPWTKLDDGLDEHPKIDVLIEDDELQGLAAIGLWALTLTNSNRRLTDGHVSERTLRKLAPKHGRRLAELLKEAGLYDDDPDGARVHNFLEFNPSRDSIEEKRRRDSERKAAGRSARSPSGIHAESTRNPNGQNAESERNPTGVRKESARPVPEPTPVPIPRTPTTKDNDPLRPPSGASNVVVIERSTTSEEAA